MARKIDLTAKLKGILKHTGSLPPEARAPLLHHDHSSKTLWEMVGNVRDAFAEGTLSRRTIRHRLAQLHSMVIVNLVETFERFLKETAAAYVDCLGRFVLDDRFNVFKVQGSVLATHYETDTIGRAPCESSIWLDTDEINDRFRKLLADPFEKAGEFYLFPKQKQVPTSESWRYNALAIVWQLRHTIVHNVGVITQSDAIKLRLMVKEQVDSPRLPMPTEEDVRFLKQFLDDTAQKCNERIGERLALLLTTISTADTGLFSPQEVADQLAAIFGIPLTVADKIGIFPPP